MTYFSYNDFMDCTEKGKVEKITKVAENISRYEQKNGHYNVHENQKQIVSILKDKTELKNFIREFLDLQEIENIIYCNIKNIGNNDVISKIKEKEIYIYIKVIQDIDNNISYKMFEDSLNIIKKWNLEEKEANKRYPIVIPIVIYVGKEIWEKNDSKNNKKIKYIKYEDNTINFSYNMIKIDELKINELKRMKNKVAKEIIDMKNKYLQIN